MARSFGSHHSDLVKGSVGALTHRIYRGTGTVSRHRAPSRVKRSPARINGPEEIPEIWSRFNAGIGYTLRTSGVDKYLVKLEDCAGGLSYQLQSTPSKQCLWIPTDPTHNNRPYIQPNGTSTYMESPLVSPNFSQPLDIWICMANSPFSATTRTIFRLNSAIATYFARSNNINWGWFWQPAGTLNLAPHSDSTVRIWRIKIQGSTAQCFWNGVAQSLPKTIFLPDYNFLRLFAVSSGTAIYDKKLFEIAIWRRILTGVEASFLLRYYRSWFNV